MCNDAIRMAIDGKPKSRFSLQELAYPRLKEFGLHSHYFLAACETAFSAYRNKTRKSVPYISKPFLKLDNLSYTLNHLLLRIPVTPRHYIFIQLEGSDYQCSFFDDPGLRRGSITINDHSVCIAWSRMSPVIEPLGYMGVDVNERNVTISATNGCECRFGELGEVVEIKERYRAVRAKVARVTRRDRRIGKGLLNKYGKRERDRTVQRIHNVTKQIVDYAYRNRFGIKMEKLTGIRKLYRRGNGKGASFRGRMNTWVFGEVQRQMNYKAAWLGVPAYYVNPRGTSQNCPECGSRVTSLRDRNLYCPACDKTWDRDDLASKNIMACVVPQARPPGGSSEREACRKEGEGTPLSRGAEADLPGGLVNRQNPLYDQGD